jgi:NCS1 family nucleobase:cation symporter-1
MAEIVKQVSSIDQPWKVERNELEPIPLSERHGKPSELLSMWFGGNINYQVITTGILLGAIGLGFWNLFTAILVGNILGCTVLGLASIMGPKTGNAGIMTSRACFGMKGAFLPSAISLFSVLGWFCISSMIGIMALERLLVIAGMADSLSLKFICAIVVVGLEVLIALYGHASIIKYESLMCVILGILFIGMLLFVLPVTNFSYAGTIEGGKDKFVMWLIACGISFSYPLSWTNFASDYSRYLPKNTSWKSIAFFAGMGQGLALILCETLGVLFVIAIGGNPDDPIAGLASVLPTWYLVPFLLSITIGCIATDVLNCYTAGLGIKAMRIPVKRVYATLAIGAFAVVFRIYSIYAVYFFDMYQTWLTFIIVWSCPWVSIVIVDYFMRRGNYNEQDLVTWGKGEYWGNNGFMWKGIISFVLGVMVALLFTNNDVFVNPFMNMFFGGLDLSYFMGVIFTGVFYYFISRKDPMYMRAPVK